MSKAEKTRDYIIERSAPLFNTKGYVSTSLSDIMEATGLTKGSIYGNFENKDEVAIAVYQHNVSGMHTRMTHAMSDKKMAAEKLIALTEFYRNNWKGMFERGGCPVQNAAIEADDHASFLKKHVQTSIKNWVGSIEKVIEDGKTNAEFKKNIDTKEYAYAIITILEGGIMLSKIMNNQKLLFSALDRIVMLVNLELKK